MSDGDDGIKSDKDYDNESGYASERGVFAHAEKFRNERVEEHKGKSTIPGPLKKDEDTGGVESGEEDKVMEKGAEGKGKEESGRKWKKAKTVKKRGNDGASVGSPTKEMKGKTSGGKSSVGTGFDSPLRNTSQKKKGR